MHPSDALLKIMTTHDRMKSTGDNNLSIVLKPLLLEDRCAAAALLAQAMRDNPLHVAVFGSDPDLRERRLSRFLGSMVAFVMGRGTVLGAYAGDELIGVLGMIGPGRCRSGLMDILRFAGVLVAGNRPDVLVRISRWLVTWARNDSPDAHWHIGPLAVDAAWRRRGVGRQLMAECCARMDVRSDTGCLETDLAINVAFYQSLGFVVTRRIHLLGVSNWFMTRLPTL